MSIKSYFGAKAFFVCLFVIWTAAEVLAGQWVLFSTDKIKALVLIRKEEKIKYMLTLESRFLSALCEEQFYLLELSLIAK